MRTDFGLQHYWPKLQSSGTVLSHILSCNSISCGCNFSATPGLPNDCASSVVFRACVALTSKVFLFLCEHVKGVVRFPLLLRTALLLSRRHALVFPLTKTMFSPDLPSDFALRANIVF